MYKTVDFVSKPYLDLYESVSTSLGSSSSLESLTAGRASACCMVGNKLDKIRTWSGCKYMPQIRYTCKVARLLVPSLPVWVTCSGHAVCKRIPDIFTGDVKSGVPVQH